MHILFIPKRKQWPTEGISTEKCSSHGINVTYKCCTVKTNNVTYNILFRFYVQIPFNSLRTFWCHYMFKVFKCLPGNTDYKLYMDHFNFSYYCNQEPRDLCQYYDYRLDGPGFKTQHLQNILSPARSELALGSTQSPIQWVLGDLSQGENWRGDEADHSPPSSVHSKNEWLYASKPTTRLQNMHRDSFTFLLPFYFTHASIPVIYNSLKTIHRMDVHF
jgi:hypothetical protein